jgi:predicted TIM-barrel fold metal-dependent hydrolase
VERAKSLGAVGICAYGTAGDMLAHDPDLDPFWAACQRHNLPVAMHTGWSSRLVHQMADTIFSATSLGAMPVIMGFFSVVGGGVLDRFPNLRVGFFEAGSEWIPYWLRRLDRYAAVYTQLQWSGPPKRRPSDYLRSGNVYVACEGDESELPRVLELVGEDYVMTSADMPHAEDVENSIQDILEREDLSADVKRKILSENPARFYGL